MAGRRWICGVLWWIGSGSSAAWAAEFYQSRPVPGYVSPLPGSQLRVQSPVVEVGTLPDREWLPDQLPPDRVPLLDDRIQSDSPDEISKILRDTQTSGSLTAPLVNVVGLTTRSDPPDPVGDVGRNHYVQMLNATWYQVFSKQGQALTPPRRLGDLWSGLPDTPGNRACYQNHGDPIVVYDHLANRWWMSQFAQSGVWSKNELKAPFYLCVALSGSSNPVSGRWILYAFEMPQLPDYPKIGVWPDGYYMSSAFGNRLNATVFDRARMLTASPTAYVQFSLSSLGATGVRDTRMLPGDLDGRPPTPGTPNYFVRTVDDRQDPDYPVDRIDIYALHADFLNGLFSFDKVNELTASEGLVPFDIMNCNRNESKPPNMRDCIPQPDTVGTLDALSNRPMMPLKFRRLANGRKFLLFNQTINVQDSLRLADGSVPGKEVAGIRWYQLEQADTGFWQIATQGTYTPQAAVVNSETAFTHRWMGSMAMDKAGNMALAYNLVNSDERVGRRIFPGIAYTGRHLADRPDRMTMPEQWIIRGTRIEWPKAGMPILGQRWGDYSSLNVDPVDNCTFWYTQHLASGHQVYKKTRIASFRFEGCLNGG